MVIVVGIDVGSLTAKITALSVENGKIHQVYSDIQHVGYNPKEIAKKLINNAKAKLKNIDIKYIVSTGYGRKLVDDANKTITEITCHGKGAFFINPVIRTVIDIGCQDSKVIRLDANGEITDFELNDKCSAGTGRFLEVMAETLEVKISDFGTLALDSTNPTPISSTCTVFAESEVISRINQGANRNDIIAGIHKTIANKISAISARVGVKPAVVLTGGVALNQGVKYMLEKTLNIHMEVPMEPQMVGSLGAALIASKNI